MPLGAAHIALGSLGHGVNAIEAGGAGSERNR
jgi:hypothetical protein